MQISHFVKPLYWKWKTTHLATKRDRKHEYIVCNQNAKINKFKKEKKS